MLGAIVGDIIGSAYEHYLIKRKDFCLFGPDCRFTDDTVLTVAVANVTIDPSPDRGIFTQAEREPLKRPDIHLTMLRR